MKYEKRKYRSGPRLYTMDFFHRGIRRLATKRIGNRAKKRLKEFMKSTLRKELDCV